MATLKERQITGKLKSNNYYNWNFKLEMLLIKEGLFELATETPTAPITKEWQKKNRKVRTIINLSI